MAVRTVYDTILAPNGEPIEGFPVTFTVKPSTSTLDATYPQRTITVQTDAAGYYEVELATGVLYEVGLSGAFVPRGVSTEKPRGSIFQIVVPEGDGKVSVPSVRIAGMEPPTPSVVDAVTAIIGETVQGEAAAVVPGLVPGVVASTLANDPDLAPGIAAQVAIQPVVTDAAAQALMALTAGIDGGTPETTYGSILVEGGMP